MRISSSHLPSEWLIVPIEKIANKVTDGEHLTPERSESGILLLSARNVQDGFLSLKEVDYVSEQEYQRIIKRCNPEYGDILISCSGTIGRVCIVPQNLRFTLVRSAALIKPGNKIYSDFLGHVLRSSFVQNQISRALNQSAQANLFINHINSLVIPLPPIAEQCKIAEILGAWDESIALLGKLITAKRKLKQGLMQQLLTGKKRFKEFEGSEWEIVKLYEVATIRRGASPRPIKDTKWFSETGRGWVRISDVTASDTYLTKTSQYLSSLGVEKSVKVEPGELIMSICATIGVPRIVGIPACIHDGFVVFRDFEDKINTFFMYHYINLIAAQLENSGQPGTQKNLNTGIVGDIEIIMFPLPEQQKIASVLSAADTEISTLEKKLAAYKQQKRGLMQQLLTGKTRVNVN